tara:strand:- start:615 stop:1928 length:1314 start_codon:yes stop_codon:yes gene_type:complete
MISKTYNYWLILKGNLWFIPAAFCLLSFGLTFGAYYTETNYLNEFKIPSYLFKGSTDDAKSVVTTLLSAMITMATLAISITIVVLSLAASQLGPRLIKSFMSDRKTKDFIGLFFGTVMACFVLTVILHARTAEASTPQITISAVLFVCLINLFVLLGFVHHVAQSCIADNVILKVARDLKQALMRLTNQTKPYKHLKDTEKRDWPKDFDQMSRRLFFEHSGYVQNIDYEAIVDFATEHNARVQIKFKAGHFLVSGEDGVRLYAKTKLPEDAENHIIDCFIIGQTRTPTQDIEYSIRHLVEIAIRALSPGINDAFTAMNVLDHLSASLSLLFEKEVPSEEFFDENESLRLIAKQSNEADIIFNALDQIRDNGAHMPSILRHMIQKLHILAELANNEDAKKGLLDQAEGLKHDLEKMDRYLSDRDNLKKAINELIKKLS